MFAAYRTIIIWTLALSCAAFGQKYGIESPLPPGARGKVLPLSGKVLELRGLSSGVSGKSEAVNAALRDLGAQTSANQIRIALSSDVLFDFDKSALRPEAVPALDKVATVLKSKAAATCTIEGYTDSLGNDRYNQALSEKRAGAVRAWLTSHGVSNPISTRGLGPASPVAPNTFPNGRDNPEGRKKNRRVEIMIKTG